VIWIERFWPRWLCSSLESPSGEVAMTERCNRPGPLRGLRCEKPAGHDDACAGAQPSRDPQWHGPTVSWGPFKPAQRRAPGRFRALVDRFGWRLIVGFVLFEAAWTVQVVILVGLLT
jgi:hypothetical protein